jgi:hypothetical protein
MQDGPEMLTNLVWSWAVVFDGFEVIDRETIIV